MRTTQLVLPIALAFLGYDSTACSMRPDWSPPTPAEALRDSEVVVQAKVLSVKSDKRGYYTDGHISVIRVIKGAFSGELVSTSAASLCGIGGFSVGRTYVFFFPRRGDWSIQRTTQAPRLSAEEVLSAIDALPEKERPSAGRLVPVKDWDLPPYESPLFTMMAPGLAIPVSVVVKSKN